MDSLPPYREYEASDFQHPSTYEALDTIDAAMFVGFPTLVELAAIRQYTQRWLKQAEVIEAIIQESSI